MPPEAEAGLPEDWVRYARSDLRIAEGPPDADVLLEMLCFHAQQAAEKGLKALLLRAGIAFPRTHNLRILVDLLPDDLNPPPEVEQAVGLSDYAVTPRYPGDYEVVSVEEYREALRLARAVVEWAARVVGEA